MSLHIYVVGVSSHPFSTFVTWPVGWDDRITAISFAGYIIFLPSVNRIHGNLQQDVCDGRFARAGHLAKNTTVALYFVWTVGTVLDLSILDAFLMT